MDLSLSKEEEMLKRAAREFCKRNCSKSLVQEMERNEKGYSPELWGEMAKLGWLGWCFPEEYGGLGQSFIGLIVLIEEFGRALMPSPFFSTVILSGLSILDIGSDVQKREYLPKIASGEAILTLALTEPSAGYDATSVRLKATADKDAYVLNGTKLFVPDAHIADYMLVVARTDEKSKAEQGITIFIVDAKTPGISCHLLKTIAGDKLCKVNFDRVKVPQENILGKLDNGWGQVQKIIERAAVAKCCEVVGAMQQVLEMTVDYAKTRVQFGRPIGSFQAIQHHCANMAIDVDSSRFITYRAAWMLSRGIAGTKEAAMAKAWTSSAYRRIALLSHQVHGAMGFTMHHDLQFYTRRAKAAEVSFGDASFHRERIAREIGLKLEF